MLINIKFKCYAHCFFTVYITLLILAANELWPKYKIVPGGFF